MPWVGFELTIPESERAKTIHTLDRAATVTGYWITTQIKMGDVQKLQLVRGYDSHRATDCTSI
jgi:hypothetical protein